MVLSPFQCLLYCSRSAFQKSDVLLCASVDCIYSFDASNGNLLSNWPPRLSLLSLKPEGKQCYKSYEKATNPTLQENKEANLDQPSKRQKLSPRQESSESTSTEILVDTESRAGFGFDRLLSLDASTAVIKLAATSNGQYVVAVTDEDKSVRVLELQNDGSLIQRSAR